MILEDVLGDDFQDTLNKANNAVGEIIDTFNEQLLNDPELQAAMQRVYDVIKRLYDEKLVVEGVQYKVALFAFPALVYHDGE